MRHRWFQIAVIALILLPIGGCMSPLIDNWADRGIQGVDVSKQNVQEFHDQFQKVLDNRKATDIDAFFDDILAAGTGQIDGVTIDPQWVEEHKAAFKLLLSLWAKDEAGLEEATEKALSNLDRIVETFEQIKKLRRAWGETDELKVQIAQLTAIVERLVQAQQSK